MIPAWNFCDAPAAYCMEPRHSQRDCAIFLCCQCACIKGSRVITTLPVRIGFPVRSSHLLTYEYISMAGCNIIISNIEFFAGLIEPHLYGVFALSTEEVNNILDCINRSIASKSREVFVSLYLLLVKSHLKIFSPFQALQ